MSAGLAINDVERHTLDPAERAGLELFLATRTRQGLPADTLRREWKNGPPELLREWKDLALRVVKAHGVATELLRWCVWPHCWRSYDATTGPTGEPWRRPGREPMCPEHFALGHHPGYGIDGDELLATCSCGAREAVSPQTWASALGWWSRHVTEVRTDG